MKFVIIGQAMVVREVVVVSCQIAPFFEARLLTLLVLLQSLLNAPLSHEIKIHFEVELAPSHSGVAHKLINDAHQRNWLAFGVGVILVFVLKYRVLRYEVGNIYLLPQ